MLKHFKIKSSLKIYEIFFTDNFKIIAKKNNYIIICDSFFKKTFKRKNFIYIKALEKNKSYDYLKKIFIQLLKKKINRDYTVVAIGGGIIQDIACYISSIYMRGLEWVYYPTTLLGMTDSCIGGKSSINLDKFKERNGPSDIYDDKQLKLLVNYENNVKNATSLKTQFENWYLSMPVLSFNGSKYDINLMKQYLHKSLEDCGEEVSFTIKKANSYMSLKSQHLQFLDVRSYLAPNYSYDAFIKAYKCKLEKGFFPYDYFNSYDKINNTELPPHEAFFNNLRNKNISDE